jgi:hypothetical protein
MLKYAKVENQITGLCTIGLSADSEYYQSIGMTLQDVEQSDVDNDWYLAEKCPHLTPEQKAQRERDRLNQLSLTKREVFLALYNDKGITPEQLKSQIQNPQALIEFEYATDYYRGNPLIDTIGQMLGYTTEQLDYLFENGELPRGE